MALTPAAREKLNSTVNYAFAEVAVLGPGQVRDRMVDALDHQLLTLTLRLHNGNQSRTAQFLGMNRNTLKKRMRVLGFAA